MADDPAAAPAVDIPAKLPAVRDAVADATDRVTALEEQVKALAKLVKYDIPARLHVLEAAPQPAAKPAKGKADDKMEARLAAIEAAAGIRQPDAE